MHLIRLQSTAHCILEPKVKERSWYVQIMNICNPWLYSYILVHTRTYSYIPVYTHSASARSRHHSLHGVGSAAGAETPSSSPLHGQKKPPVAPRSIQWGYQIPIEGACTLHGSSGLQHGELPWPFFQDLNCRNTVFPTFARPMLGLEDAHTVQKVRPIYPKHGRGSQGDWDSRASQWKKTYNIVGQTYDIVS
jgi:hypothetical protein